MTAKHDGRSESTTDTWITPRHITEALGHFDLDPCEHTEQPWKHADRGFTIHDDGLTQPWDGFVWLNPPYGREGPKWIERLAEHDGGGIALVAVRTDTKWWHDLVFNKAGGVLFLQGRVQFCRGDGSLGHGNTFASALVGYGCHRAQNYLSKSGLAGKYIRLLGFRGYQFRP